MSFETVAGGLNPHRILDVRRLPGKLTADQTATLLGFASHDIPVLVAAGLLKPLGKPIGNSCKWFASSNIEEFRTTPKWLDVAAKAVSSHWRHQNAKRKERLGRTPEHPVPPESDAG